MAENHNLINQDSGIKDWYTDPVIVEAARELLGGEISLDPASSERANLAIKAGHIFESPGYTHFDYIDIYVNHYFESSLAGALLPWREYHDRGGLDREWFGTVWLNHPFGRAERACSFNCTKKVCVDRGWHTMTDLPGNRDWIKKLVAEYKHGGMTAACCITYASFGSQWMRPLREFPHWKPPGRVHYITPSGERAKAVTKESVVHYLGPRHAADFALIFERRLGGHVYQRVKYHTIKSEGK